jgi:hypothetical protein
MSNSTSHSVCGFRSTTADCGSKSRSSLEQVCPLDWPNSLGVAQELVYRRLRRETGAVPVHSGHETPGVASASGLTLLTLLTLVRRADRAAPHILSPKAWHC